MLLLPLLALLALPLCQALVTKQQAHDELVKLSNANNGVVNVDDRTFEMLTHPNRDWSSIIVFTAMDPRRKCAPCRYKKLTEVLLYVSNNCVEYSSLRLILSRRHGRRWLRNIRTNTSSPMRTMTKP